jgi:hypothetical protein
MADQLPLFDDLDPHTHARATDPETSHAAARSIASTAKHHVAQIARVLRTLPDGGTKDELAARLPFGEHEVGRRLPDCEKAGVARRRGDTRPGCSGRACEVWEAPDA